MTTSETSRAKSAQTKATMTGNGAPATRRVPLPCCVAGPRGSNVVNDPAAAVHDYGRSIACNDDFRRTAIRGEIKAERTWCGFVVSHTKPAPDSSRRWAKTYAWRPATDTVADFTLPVDCLTVFRWSDAGCTVSRRPSAATILIEPPTPNSILCVLASGGACRNDKLWRVFEGFGRQNSLERALILCG